MPKTVLSGTEMAATSRVSRIAERASGSVTAASQACQPCFERLGQHRAERQQQHQRDVGEARPRSAAP